MMEKAKVLSEEAVKGAYESLKSHGYAPTVDTLLTQIIFDGNNGYWTYFDEMAHRLYGYRQGAILTDDEVTQAIQAFKTYKKWAEQ
ncbi:hypothetical protein LB941_00910 [Ligilactobacillus sp. WILCCON 0076]|uniref:Uncharacterized protein n=1 Tax=Ligilactobacillus ubinensis TaxID=2876789 RepID=A0A9X2FJW9_9LACO|nr:hypothetical protein [Ligilactobacillus ubinensis]MCP0885893.1 hypothetical protein [Ligilactobacillus ubinensis]